MKLTYLGTAAAEGAPGVFCHCAHCRAARRLGGKNIRTRSQSLLNDDLLIDLPPDTYQHFLQYGIEGDRIPYLLITHPHSDHFYAQDLLFRRGAYAHDMRVEEIAVFGTASVREKLIALHGHLPSKMTFTVMTPFETVSVGEYLVTALPARHMLEEQGAALNYIIEREGKALYYAHDTGLPFDEVFDFIKEKKFRFDLVSMDCTCGDMPTPDEAKHMGIENNRRMVDHLRALGAITPETVLVINHFSHNCDPLQERLERLVAADGWQVAFDGREVEF